MTPSDPTRRPGRPRSPQTDRVILDATLQELAEVGYEALTMQGVAQRAGVGKTTIYRRWPSKQHLVLAALQALQAEVPLVDTGHLRLDLLTMVESALALGVSHPHLQSFALRAATELTAQPALLQEAVRHVLPTRFQDFADLIERAKARGELRADLRSEVAFSLVAGPIYYHWLLGEIVSPSAPRRLAEQIVDGVMYGIASAQ